MADKRWVVTASGDRSINDLKKDLTDAGFSVDEVFEEIGSITGTTKNDGVADSVKSIPGVSDVAPEEPIDIGPPDAPVTW